MLTDAMVRDMVPKNQSYMKCDSQGLYIRVMPSGRKTWVFRSQGEGAKVQTLGTWPQMRLYDARRARDDLARQIKNEAAGVCTFRALAERWLDATARRTCTDKHIQRMESRLAYYLYPAIGDISVSEITSPMLYQIVSRVEADGKVELAHRLTGLVGQILRYGIPQGLVPQGDVTRDLRGSLSAMVTIPRAHLETPPEVASLMRRIDAMKWGMSKAGLLLQAMTLVRPGELRAALWEEIDLVGGLWRIPAEKMKMRRVHLVPLSRQAIEVLQHLRETLSADSPLVLHGVRSLTRPLGDMTLLSALRDLGYEKSEMSVHGFRSIGSTLLNESGWPPDAIEAQLAHYVGGTVRAVYNYAQYMDTRVRMMQWYSDYLEALRDGKKMPPLKDDTL